MSASFGATPPRAVNGYSGNPVLYISFYNAGTGTSSISFGNTTPAIAFSPTAGGTLAGIIAADVECQFDLYDRGTSSWTAIPGAFVMFSPGATSVSIPSAPLPNGSTLNFTPGQRVGAISCD